MSATEYLQCLNLHLDPGALEAEHYRRFYLDHGLDAETTQRVVTGGHAYLRLLSGLPPTYHRVVAGDVLRIGGRDFEVLTGGGHSPEEIMLFCRADKLFLSADQVLAKISPNVSVAAIDPEGDPLGQYLRSLNALKRDIGDDVLVLPGHNLPFHGLHARIEGLIAHHHARCDRILRACRTEPRSAAELVPFVYHAQARSAPDGFRLRRGAGACELLAAARRAQAGRHRRRHSTHGRRVSARRLAACRPA